MPSIQSKLSSVFEQEVLQLLSLDMRLHQNKYNCEICNRGFNYSSHLSSHVRTHTLERPYKCLICGQGFKQKPQLDSHLKSVHEKCKDYPCTFCEKTFCTKAEQFRHLLSHIQEKPHACNFCDRTFTTVGIRNGHLRTHTLERFHKCVVCDKSFRDSSALGYHKKTHLKVIPRPHECSQCKAKFTVKQSLKRHILRVHDNSRSFQCDGCSRTFKTAANLNQHQRIVHQKTEHSHWCVFCSKVFYARDNLNSHILSHLKERHFPCHVCDKRFLNSSNRDHHVRRVHLL